MKLLTILVVFCVGFVISERSHRHHQTHFHHEHRTGPHYEHSHRGNGFNRDDKYNYFYGHFGEGEGRPHESSFGHRAGRREKDYCKPTDPCWPTTQELNEIYEALNPNLHRSLFWDHSKAAVPCAIPEDSTQPLYGEGLSLSPFSVNDGTACTTGPESLFCRLTVRNNPLEGWSPAFVAWPTTPAQVQLLVKFATLHNLCISVTNTGHDYLNRHSCDHSLDIRASLLKDVAWDASPFSVRVGAGVTSSELQYEASLVGKLVVTPWSKSVGMVGWSLGGGRSLLAPRYGLGADQIVGVQLVGPDGCLYDVDVTGTEKRHLDGRVEQFEDCELLWAVRGGGGSTWGVITALTLKTHPVPQGGATATGLLFTAYGDCTNDFSSLLELYFSWSLTLDSKWAGTASVVPYPSDDGCNMWGFVITYFYQGGDNYLDTWKAFTRNVPEGISPYESIEEHITLWDIFLRADLEKILPEPFLAPVDHFSGAWPSVLLSRETVKSGALVEIMKTQLGKCTADQCDSWEFSQDLTGNINSPQDADVSISPGMRTSILHLRIPRTQELSLYDALGKHSYFSESAYMMEDWPERYWGNRNYRRLSHIKKAFDENNVFWCRHCVGDLQNTSHSHF